MRFLYVAGAIAVFCFLLSIHREAPKSVPMDFVVKGSILWPIAAALVLLLLVAL